MKNQRPKILLVDDMPNVLDALSYHFERHGYDVITAESSKEALLIYKKNMSQIALCIIDFHLKESKGTDLTSYILANNSEAQIVILSSDKTSETFSKSIESGAIYFCEKGESREMAKLDAIVKKFYNNFLENLSCKTEIQSHIKNQKLIESIGIKGKSSQLAKIAKKVIKYKDSVASVIITGETGTGKEVLAKALHNNSKRAEKPFIVVNCGAIPENLIESELFGHKRGAFTGAVTNNNGAFRDAHGGTLFLDEIGELPLDAQAKILRAVQEKQIKPLGTSETFPINVRIICATHRNLEEMVAGGSFREDLFYRLCVLPIESKPLRERPEDIPILLSHFLESIQKREKWEIKISNAAMKIFSEHEWSGNVRQLANAAELLVIEAKRNYKIISKKHALNALKTTVKQPKIEFQGTTYAAFKSWLLKLEYDHIMGVVSSSKSLRDAAKNKLNVSPSTVSGRLAMIEEKLSAEELA